MSTVHTTIAITEQEYKWISAQIEAGRYADASACISDLIQRELALENATNAVRAALMVGESSGEPQPFDKAAFKQRMQKAQR